VREINTVGAIVLALAIPYALAAEGYLPQPCEESAPDPSFFPRCPSPYVEMVATERDELLDRAWHCRETGYSLVHVRDEGGCGGWTGTVDGWIVPAQSATVEPDYRAEIMEHVVDPCYLDMAHRNPVEGISPNELIEITKLMSGDAIETMIDNLRPIAAKMADLNQRLAFYEIGRRVCINAARDG